MLRLPFIPTLLSDALLEIAVLESYRAPPQFAIKIIHSFKNEIDSAPIYMSEQC